MPHAETHRCLAVCPPGVEDITASELAGVGVRIRRAFRGGVEFGASDRQLYAANLWSRTATRIVVRVARFTATTFSELEREVDAVPWDRWVPPGTSPRVRVSSTASRLYHTDAIAERVASCAGGGPGAGPLVVVRLVHDRVTVSVDSSGAPLHQRGWRLDSGTAPLRETLAAAALMASGWDKESPLIDPFCGSGSIVVEAALMAAGRPPGAGRRFGFQDWPSFAPGTWASVTAGDEGARPRSTSPLFIGGGDRDGAVIAAARANAARAGVDDAVMFSNAPFSAVAPPGDRPGWIVSNPPYGKRAGNGDLRGLYAKLGTVMQERFAGWTVALLVADRRLAGISGLPLEPRLQTSNGGIPVHLLVGTVPVRSPHGHDDRSRSRHRRAPR